MSRPMIFKVAVEFESEVEIGNEIKKSCIIAVTKNQVIRTAADAVQHCIATTGKDADGKDVTRIHWRDGLTGEFVNIKTATAVRDEPFLISEAPALQSIADAPQPTKEP